MKECTFTPKINNFNKKNISENEKQYRKSFEINE